VLTRRGFCGKQQRRRYEQERRRTG
jgi:hypothetical protein